MPHPLVGVHPAIMLLQVMLAAAAHIILLADWALPPHHQPVLLQVCIPLLYFRFRPSDFRAFGAGYHELFFCHLCYFLLSSVLSASATFFSLQSASATFFSLRSASVDHSMPTEAGAGLIYSCQTGLMGGPPPVTVCLQTSKGLESGWRVTKQVLVRRDCTSKVHPGGHTSLLCVTAATHYLACRSLRVRTHTGLGVSTFFKDKRL